MDWIESNEWGKEVQKIKYFKNLPNLFSEFGVALVYVKYLPKTVYGAIRWIDGNPLIQISDRNKSLAVCWVTLFHEIGHAILHENEEIFDLDIDTTKTNKNNKEIEANKFSYEYLFNGDKLRKEIFAKISNRECISPKELSEKYDVDELFVGYWLNKIRYSNSNYKYITIQF
ncbi:MAG: ImmA/IrrE family metallo-endopeptidase [Bacteroidales bacterium]|jgi:Zn-dependent peptidase ImmA (M78 family)|nr:ImmA/IrrE family metallo-endopeptidase [Bacteroidales bacterium]